MILLKQNRDLSFLNQLFEDGTLTPVIDGPYRLREAREAFRHFEAANSKGKVVITMDCRAILAQPRHDAPGRVRTWMVE